MGTRGCSMGGRTDGGHSLSCRERCPKPIAVAACPDCPVAVAVHRVSRLWLSRRFRFGRGPWPHPPRAEAKL
eukprot:3647802-Pyramimonas_sp.AAC.1